MDVWNLEGGWEAVLGAYVAGPTMAWWPACSKTMFVLCPYAAFLLGLLAAESRYPFVFL